MAAVSRAQTVQNAERDVFFVFDAGFRVAKVLLSGSHQLQEVTIPHVADHGLFAAVVVTKFSQQAGYRLFGWDGHGKLNIGLIGSILD